MLSKNDLEQIKDIITQAIQTSEKNIKAELKEEILQFKDEVMGRFQHIDEEIAILAGHQDVWEDHENRIQNIEKHIFTN